MDVMSESDKTRKSRRIRHVRRILIIKPSSMGDVMHAFKAVQLLSECYPKAVFDWLINPEFTDLLSYSPVAIADTVLFQRKKIGRLSTFIPEMFSLLRELRRYRYDLVIDFQGLLRSALLTWFSRHKHSAGFASPREKEAARWYRRKVEIPPEAVHAIDRNLALAAYYCDRTEPQHPFTLPANDRNMQRARRKLEHRRIDQAKGVVAVFPGARWHSKTFPARLFADLVNDLHRSYPEHAFLIMGSINENGPASAVVKQCGSHTYNLAGTTRIGEMVELIRMADLVLSNDSGPLHIADALNVPTIGFFGPTDPARTGPVGPESVIFQRSVPCKNCQKRECKEAEELCFKLPYDKILETAKAMMEKSLSKKTDKPEKTT